MTADENWKWITIFYTSIFGFFVKPILSAFRETRFSIFLCFTFPIDLEEHCSIYLRHFLCKFTYCFASVCFNCLLPSLGIQYTHPDESLGTNAEIYIWHRTFAEYVIDVQWRLPSLASKIEVIKESWSSSWHLEIDKSNPKIVKTFKNQDTLQTTNMRFNLMWYMFHSTEYSFCSAH